MIEEQEIDSLKRKNRLADQNMLSNINGEIDEDSQLVLDDDRKQTPLKMKHKMQDFDSDEELKPTSQKKLLLDESDMEMNQKHLNNGMGNIPLAGSSLSINRSDSEMLFDGDNTMGGPNSSMETIDAFVGPVKKEFDDLKRRIEEKDAELVELEAKFYKRVSAKSVELEGIGKDEEEEIERHRHLFEM